MLGELVDMDCHYWAGELKMGAVVGDTYRDNHNTGHRGDNRNKDGMDKDKDLLSEEHAVEK